jgi:hypothetical protein
MEYEQLFPNSIGLPQELVPLLARASDISIGPWPEEDGRTIDINTARACGMKRDKGRR